MAPTERDQHHPGRRQLLLGAGAAAGVAWIAPQLVSQPAAAAASLACVLCATNLVDNPSAETFSGNPDYDNPLSSCSDLSGSAPILTSGWTTTQNGFRVVSYGHCDFPTTTDVSPAPGSNPPQGSVMFSGPLTDAAVPARAYQEIDVSACASDIDAGLVDFDFRAYLGGNPATATSAAAYALFYASLPVIPGPGTPLPPGGTLGASTLGPLDSTSLASTQLVQSIATGTLPVSTRFVRIALEITTPSGLVPADGRVTGCVDMVSFTLC